MIWRLIGIFWLSFSYSVFSAEDKKPIPSKSQEAGIQKTASKKELHQKEPSPVNQEIQSKEAKQKSVNETDKTSKKHEGIRVIKLKKSYIRILKKLHLKSGDVIFKIDGVYMKTPKSVLKSLKKIRKKKTFSLTVLRGYKTLLLKYSVKRDPKSLKYKYKIKSHSVLAEDFLKKHSYLLHKAYVIQPGGSLIYTWPSFDAGQIQMIPYGEKITISRKVLKPEREIGSFYKVFIKEPKKVAGYISEAEVLPELVRKDKKYISNPKYKLWKKGVQKKTVDKETSVPNENFTDITEKKSSSKNVSLTRFVGVSLGFSFESEKDFFDQIRFGLKLSGYNLLISYINMDMNLTFHPQWKDMSFDIMGGYTLLKAGRFQLGASAGLKMDMQFDPQAVKPDLLVSLNGLFLFTRRLVWRNDVFFSGFFQDQQLSGSPYFLSALQWGF